MWRSQWLPHRRGAQGLIRLPKTNGPRNAPTWLLLVSKFPPVGAHESYFVGRVRFHAHIKGTFSVTAARDA